MAGMGREAYRVASVGELGGCSPDPKDNGCYRRMITAMVKTHDTIASLQGVATVEERSSWRDPSAFTLHSYGLVTVGASFGSSAALRDPKVDWCPKAGR